MSGRTGISLASTVSSVIDVPATQSSGVARIWPAWTDAISSSVEAKSRPPFAGDVGLVRLDDQRPGSGRASPTSDHDHRADRAIAGRASGRVVDRQGQPEGEVR